MIRPSAKTIACKITTYLRSTISLAILLAIMLGIAPAAALELPTRTANDPFAEMIDEYVMLSGSRTMAEIAQGSLLESDSAASQIPPEIEARLNRANSAKTDRYIVKYRDGRAASFEQKIAPMLEATIDILLSDTLQETQTPNKNGK